MPYSWPCPVPNASPACGSCWKNNHFLLWMLGWLFITLVCDCTHLLYTFQQLLWICSTSCVGIYHYITTTITHCWTRIVISSALREIISLLLLFIYCCCNWNCFASIAMIAVSTCFQQSIFQLSNTSQLYCLPWLDYCMDLPMHGCMHDRVHGLQLP